MGNIEEGAPTKVTKEHIIRAKELFEISALEAPPSAKEVIEYATELKGIDARSKFGKALMLQLHDIGIDPKRAHQYRAKKSFILLPEQQLFIKNNADRLSSMECAKNLFGESVQPLSQEARSVREFYEAIPSSMRFQSSNEVAMKEFSSPKSLERILPRLNKYIHPPIDRAKMTNAEKLHLEALIGFVNTNKFLRQINTYKLSEDREYFEGLFMRYCYDKPDLTQEEVDQYIILCVETIIGDKNRQTYQGLQELLDDAIEAQSEDSSKATLRMGLIEAMKTKEDEWHKCVTRQSKLKENLQGRRSDRISQKDKNHGSWLPIIETWKHHEGRKKMIALAGKRKKKLKQSLHEYANMDQLIFEAYGITEEEVLFV